MADPIAFILGFLIIIYSVILHEIAHGWVAERLGDPTARRAGRLTLNPIPHVDPLMTILVPALLFFTTGFVIGAAKPVPVNALYFKDPKKDMALVAMAGALTNFALAGLGSLVFHAVDPLGMSTLASTLIFMVTMNLALGVFNLVPIPPLDGSKVLAAVLPRNAAAALLALEPYGFIILGLLLFTSSFGFVFRIVHLLLGLLGMPY